PDLAAAAERARREAERAARRGAEEEADDHATRARLLLAAAITEAERLEHEEARRDAERRARELEARALEAERERSRIVRRTRRRLAAQVAERQAERAFAHAAEVEQRHARWRGREAKARYREAAAALRERAHLLLAAAMAMGLEEDAVTAVRGRIEASENERVPHVALAEAEEAVRAALGVLGEVRARREGPSEAEVATLWQTAREMGLKVQRSARGTVLAPRDGRWSSTARGRLVSLLKGHPHGPVHLEARAKVRGAALRDALVKQGLARERLEVRPVGRDGPIRVVLLAYVPEADQPR
ncbi:MAG: hypothetical protein ACODAU_11345, partial [Myxococcota bacterium]